MKILLVDDHGLFRAGFRLLLQQVEPAAEIIEAGSCTEGFNAAAEHADLSLVLLDLGLPDMSGMEGLEELRNRFPGIPVVVLSASDDRDTVMEALDRGAMGFIPKSSNTQVLTGALQIVFANGVYIPPSILTRGPSERVSPDPAAERKISNPAELGLTERQIDVLQLLVQGQSNKMIARKLDLAEATVKVHVTAVLRALKVTTRTQAVLAVGRMGISFRQRPAAQP